MLGLYILVFFIGLLGGWIIWGAVKPDGSLHVVTEDEKEIVYAQFDISLDDLKKKNSILLRVKKRDKN